MEIIDILQLFGLLMCAHCLADYPLQGDFLSKAKNEVNPIPGVPWWQAMWAHSIIHGGFVGIITGSLALGIAETMFHNVIDRMKCRGMISYNTDQALHVLCKVLWLIIMVMVQAGI